LPSSQHLPRLRILIPVKKLYSAPSKVEDPGIRDTFLLQNPAGTSSLVRRFGIGPDLSTVSAVEPGEDLYMKYKLALLLITGALAGAVDASPAVALICTPTGFIRDGMDMTAKVIANGDISGQTIDASGCNIGIYYGPGTSGTVESSEVFGANYFGIVATGEDSLNVGTTSVDVKNSSIHNIGDK